MNYPESFWDWNFIATYGACIVFVSNIIFILLLLDSFTSLSEKFKWFLKKQHLPRIFNFWIFPKGKWLPIWIRKEKEPFDFFIFIKALQKRIKTWKIYSIAYSRAIYYTINFFYKIFYKENYNVIFFIHSIIYYIPEAGWFDDDPTGDNSEEKEEEKEEKESWYVALAKGALKLGAYVAVTLTLVYIIDEYFLDPSIPPAPYSGYDGSDDESS